MSGSVFGRNFTLSTWGESHGKAVGVCIDGCPSGLELDEEYIQRFLDRRRPGQSSMTTQRSEKDKVRILSGVFEGITTGTPVSLLVENSDSHSKDYNNIKDIFRPGHADYSFYSKYGIRDYRGGGRSSGRETIGRVAGGAVAIKILNELGITVSAFTRSIGPVTANETRLEECNNNPLYMPDPAAALKAVSFVEEMKAAGNSAGGIIECRVRGLKSGIGEPVFNKLDALLGQALFSIGAVKGVEIGAGFSAAELSGYDNNDEWYISKEGKPVKKTNNSGGILGGMSDGDEIIIKAAVKPTPSVSMEQKSIDINGREVEFAVKGRHDPVIVPRAVVVVEAMTAVTVLDLLMDDMRSKMDYLKSYYDNTGV